MVRLCVLVYTYLVVSHVPDLTTLIVLCMFVVIVLSRAGMLLPSLKQLRLADSKIASMRYGREYGIGGEAERGVEREGT